jgi:vacuolar-type H+-ATPase subunit E/Vma4
MSARDEAQRALSASEWQQQKWGEGATDDELQSAALEAQRAIANALLDVADAIREQTEALHPGGIQDALDNIAHAAGKPRG